VKRIFTSSSERRPSRTNSNGSFQEDRGLTSFSTSAKSSTNWIRDKTLEKDFFPDH